MLPILLMFHLHKADLILYAWLVNPEASSNVIIDCQDVLHLFSLVHIIFWSKNFYKCCQGSSKRMCGYLVGVRSKLNKYII